MVTGMRDRILWGFYITNFVFFIGISHAGTLMVMNADGSGQTRLTNIPGFDGEPVWSPDGSRIAFSSDRDGGI